MAREVLVTSDEFRKVKNAYTGQPMRVLMVLTATGQPMFHAAPEEYAPCREQPTPKACYDLWNRVDGVGGMRSNQPVRCAYTGEPMELVMTKDGAKYEGGFNPFMLYTRADFLYRATMRDGKSKYPPPGPVQRVMKSTARPDMPDSRRNKDRGGDVSGEAVDLAAAAMQQHKDAFDQHTTVHISKQRGKGRR